MAKRTPLKKRTTSAGNYFSKPKEDVDFFSSGCRLLDLALGGGWAERRVSNVIGDRCLAGDTIVSVQRGTKPRKMTLAALYKRHHGHHHNKQRTLETHLLADVGGYVETVRMADIIKTGTKQLYKITDELGNTIRASKNHKFYTTNGWESLSTGLRVGTRVHFWHSARRSGDNLVRKHRSYTYSIPYHPHGQQNVVEDRDYKRLPTCRLIIEATMNDMDLDSFIQILRKDPKRAAALQYTDPSLEVHHRNDDCGDDSFNNLMLLTPEEHYKMHAESRSVAIRKTSTTRIVSITKDKVEPTFDVTMEAPYHNFIANGFVVHNSTGKTLIAIEAATNFARKYPKAKIRYRETEHAFQQKYAEALGMPLNRVDFGEPMWTVEDLFEELQYRAEHSKQPEFFIVDSLDALTSRAEQKRGIDEGSYGGEKAKKMSELFRRLIGAMEDKDITLMIISQIRDKIGAMFGRKWTRSGGRALDFYSSQNLVLAHLGQVQQTINKIKRATGVTIKAQVDKNKVGLAYRSADFNILFGYGIDDAKSCVDWLESTGGFGHENEALSSMKKDAFLKAIHEGCPGLDNLFSTLHAAVDARWYEIEDKFLPKAKKYA
jgi:recombination protein RecA